MNDKQSGHHEPRLDITFRRYNASEARRLRDVVETVYAGAYVDQISSGSTFDTADEFMRRFDAYASNPDLDLVIAYRGEQAIGQAWGWPLTAQSAWWNGLLAEPEPGFTQEDGERTFALSEIMVIQEHTGKGVAHALHDALLGARRESRATLLVRPDNTKAYGVYQLWGWHKVAQLHPGWENAPTFDVLVRELGDRR